MALIDTTQLTLFGFDLTQLASWFRLGCRQLLWERQSPVKALFYPAVSVVSREDLADAPSGMGTIASDAKYKAVVIDSGSLLTKVVELPVSTELFLEEAVALDAMNHSPFASDDTVLGWCVEGRDGATVAVRWALAANGSVALALRAAGIDPDAEPEGLPEVWADIGDGSVVRLQGFGEGRRDGEYVSRLQSVALRAAGVFVLCLTLVSLSAVYASLSTAKLEQRLADVTQEAQRATRIRERLGEERELLNVASQFVADRSPSRTRLHAISQLTPDSVYLQRLQFKGNEAGINGLGENAADYLAILAESNQFAQLAASSAFTRDRRTGLERFTIDIKFESEAAND